MRYSPGRTCIRTLLVVTLLYTIVPARWITGFFGMEKAPEELTATDPSPDRFVPNIVHFIRFGNSSLTFIDAVCILAALRNQKPHILYIHTDQRNFDEVWGKYWKVVMNQPAASGVIAVRYLRMPTSVFGKGFHPEFALYHASDVARLRILIEYGGIYLDNDSYIVRSLEGFFDFEMTLGWESGGGISDQVLIAKRNARFLRMWLESYRDYRRNEWFYNAGDLPTKILKKHRELVHTVPNKLAEYKTTPGLIYYQNTDEWKTHFAIHLLINHQYMLLSNISLNATYPVKFNEVNILHYPVTIRQMALDVYPFSEKIKKQFESVYPQLISTEHSRRGRLVKKSHTRSMENFTTKKSNTSVPA